MLLLLIPLSVEASILHELPPKQFCTTTEEQEEVNYIATIRPGSLSQKLENCVDFYGQLILCAVSASQLSLIADDVIALEKDNIATIVECQTGAQWHLTDISSQQEGKYAYDPPASDDVNVYIVDTWVDVEHFEFEGRAFRGPAFAQGENSHGTHVAGLVASRTFGVNKRARVFSVQVLNQDGVGAWSQIIAGLSWIAKNGLKRSIINISIGGPKSQAVNQVLALMRARQWKIVVAAGNSKKDACETSPAGSPDVLTVGAHDMYRNWASFSNYGRCVDISAPGVDILSLYPNDRAATNSGTSMAAPIVAGVWSMNFQLTQKQLMRDGLRDRLSNLPDASTNNLISQLRHNSQCGVDVVQSLEVQ